MSGKCWEVMCVFGENVGKNNKSKEKYKKLGAFGKHHEMKKKQESHRKCAFYVFLQNI